MVLPSKELLSAVLGEDIKEISKKTDLSDDIWYSIDDGEPLYINMYKLMHIMKEWAFNKWYDIYSCIDGKEGYAYIYYFKNMDVSEFEKNKINYDIEVEGVNEFEAIIKACEWILEQQK